MASDAGGLLDYELVSGKKIRLALRLTCSGLRRVYFALTDSNSLLATELARDSDFQPKLVDLQSRKQG